MKRDTQEHTTRVSSPRARTFESRTSRANGRTATSRGQDVRPSRDTRADRAGRADRSSRADRARSAARSARGASASRTGERTLFLGAWYASLRRVPARFMRPRILFVLAIAILSIIGLLMVFSASSITALTNSFLGNNPIYFLVRQAGFMAVGILGAFLISRMDYHLLCHQFLWGIFGIALMLLLLIFTPIAGHDAGGASRWISIASFSLQPSEFTKFILVLMFARIACDYQDHLFDMREFMKRTALFICLPLLLIFAQPDKGTSMVLVITFLVMAFYAGFSGKWCLILTGLGIVGLLAMSLRDNYARLRLLGMLDPWKSPEKYGYQLIQGFYAFANGGLFGTGIGMGKQKYGYLPMAYNDFIFSVIGEEMGLIGAVVVLACFGLILYSGLKIAHHAHDMEGRLIVVGVCMMFVIQTALNISGVLGIFPLSGKPIPFVSYGGSSIISSFLLMGLVLSVSRSERLPQTIHDEARQDLHVQQGGEGLVSFGDPIAFEQMYGKNRRSEGTRSRSSRKDTSDRLSSPSRTGGAGRAARTSDARSAQGNRTSGRSARTRTRTRTQAPSSAPILSFLMEKPHSSSPASSSVSQWSHRSKDESQGRAYMNDVDQSRHPLSAQTSSVAARRRNARPKRPKPSSLQNDPHVRLTKNENGITRIDVGPSPVERLRNTSSSQRRNRSGR